MIRSDIHVHTCFCDGKGTPAQVAAAAANAGADSLGLLGHAQMAIPCDYCLTEEAEARLYAETKALKKEYAGKLTIFSGMEMDYYSKPLTRSYDYVIGSVHYLKHEGMIMPVDENLEMLTNDTQEIFGGDFYKMAKCYYEHVAECVRICGADIVGHFDLLTKFNEQRVYLEEDDRRYRSCAMEACEALLEEDPIFEINTGAISRGYRTAPYPSLWILKGLYERKGRIMLNSDSHSPETLFFGFDKAAEFARAAGFRSAWVLTANGFEEIALDE